MTKVNYNNKAFFFVDSTNYVTSNPTSYLVLRHMFLYCIVVQ